MRRWRCWEHARPGASAELDIKVRVATGGAWGIFGTAWSLRWYRRRFRELGAGRPGRCKLWEGIHADLSEGLDRIADVLHATNPLRFRRGQRAKK